VALLAPLGSFVVLFIACIAKELSVVFQML
jgi:hypothetical protein